MNVKQAKEVPIDELLRQCGYEPTRENGETVWYRSPLRDERTPSFKVNRSRNLWIDFGDGRGGDVIDLAKELFDCPDVSSALQAIERAVGATPIVLLPQKKRKPEPTPDAEILIVGPVKSRSLLHYMKQRGIDPALVTDLVGEVRYRRGGKEYFAIGFPNDAGGYELRTAAFKGTLGRKEITLIPGDWEHAAVFEGFFDYLTAVMLNGGPLGSVVIVLNSTALAERAMATLKELGVQRVDLYRDNDAAGRELLESFQTAWPEATLVDRSTDYPDHSDLNAAHAADGVFGRLS
ncbi:MAG: toprim domain-containing protein [Planctomycetota bacterium]